MCAAFCFVAMHLPMVMPVQKDMNAQKFFIGELYTHSKDNALVTTFTVCQL
jgi:hypothetical protein